MRILSVATAVAFLAALLAPAAAGYAQPAFYFFKSGCPIDEVDGVCYFPDVTVPPVPPLPPPLPAPPIVGQPKIVIADGILDPYDFAHPNVPNSTEPDVKLVYPGAESVVPVRFVTPANHTHPDRLKGSFLIGVWIGESPAPQANLTATLYEVKADGTEVPLANASVVIDLNASHAPDPATLVPPNSTDPMTIVLYEVAQLAPLVLQPPLILLLGPVDRFFANTSSFAVGFRLDPGSSPLPAPPGAASIRFNASLSPSFVYVPWYAPDPPKSSSTKTYSFSRSSSGPRGTFGSSGSGDDEDGKKKGNGIPGFEVSLVFTMLAVAAVVARRRL
ncbi:MAG: hypothetical protein AABY18_04250 [Candidatus Thermoplasmatota archaeon]